MSICTTYVCTCSIYVHTCICKYAHITELNVYLMHCAYPNMYNYSTHACLISLLKVVVVYLATAVLEESQLKLHDKNVQ